MSASDEATSSTRVVEDGKKGFSRYGKTKQVVARQLSKAKKQIHNRSHKRGVRTSSGLGKTENMIVGNGGTSGCYFCFSRPQVVESPVESPSSDPNGPTFTYATLKTLLEKNDFYSKDCNPHIDI